MRIILILAGLLAYTQAGMFHNQVSMGVVDTNGKSSHSGFTEKESMEVERQK